MGQAVIEEVVVAEGNRVISKNHGRLAESFHGFFERDALSTAICMRKTRPGRGLSRQIRAG